MLVLQTQISYAPNGLFNFKFRLVYRPDIHYLYIKTLSTNNELNE